MYREELGHLAARERDRREKSVRATLMLRETIAKSPKRAARELSIEYDVHFESPKKRRKSAHFVREGGRYLLERDNRIIMVVPDPMSGREELMIEPHFLFKSDLHHAQLVAYTHPSITFVEKTHKNPANAVLHNGDLVGLILGHLKPVEMLKCRLVCRRWRTIASRDSVWTPPLRALQRRIQQSTVGIESNANLATFEQKAPLFRQYVQLALIGLTERRKALVRVLVDERHRILASLFLAHTLVHRRGALTVLHRTAADRRKGRWLRFRAHQLYEDAPPRMVRLLAFTGLGTNIFFVPPRRAELICDATNQDVLAQCAARWRAWVDRE